MIRIESVCPPWPVILERISRLVLQRIPAKRRQPLDIVDAIQTQCPEAGWLTIAAWFGDLHAPSLDQQQALWDWIQNFSDHDVELNHVPVDHHDD